mgnify:CR=1 FL=1
MKKSILAFLIAAPLLLASCVRNNGLCYQHKDENLDGICDVCGAEVEIDHEHIDIDADGKCDFCGHSMLPPGPAKPCEDGKHVDKDLDNVCDVCGAKIDVPAHEHVDSNGDHKCDTCGATMEECTNHVDANNDGKCDYCGHIMEQPSEVTVYLVLTSVGLYKGAVGLSYADLNLENAIVFKGLSGTALPGEADVTHATNAKAHFENWLCYEGKGAPTVYTTVPYENNKILYANFVADGYSPVPGPTPGPTPTPVGLKTFNLRTNFQDGSGDWHNEDDPKFFVWAWSDTNRGQPYDTNYVSESYYSFEIPENTTGMLFVRVSNTVTTFDWNTVTVWNQTHDLNVEAGKTCAQITCWHMGGGESGPSGVIWVA